MAWVSTSPLIKTYTLEEFWELPEQPDHSKLELIAGVLYMTPTPGQSHNNTVSRLVRLISDHLTKTNDKGTLYVPRAGIVKGPNSWLESDLFDQPFDKMLGIRIVAAKKHGRRPGRKNRVEHHLGAGRVEGFDDASLGNKAGNFFRR